MFLAVLQFAHAVTDAPAFSTLSNCMCCPIGCGTIAWFIAGIVFRWRHIGKVCSGDFAVSLGVQDGAEPYMWKSGMFIFVYYITMAGLLVLGCLIFMVCACVLAKAKN